MLVMIHGDTLRSDVPFSIVPNLLSGLPFTVGIFWNGANSTIAMDSFPAQDVKDSLTNDL